MATKTIVSGYKDVNTFAYLYIGARHQRNIARKEKDGQLYTIMCSYISLAFCLEAYLNHVGKLRIKNWTKIERKLSQKLRLKKICEIAGLNINYEISPFLTVNNLFNFRDNMAHGKSERFEDSFIVEGELLDSDHRIEPEWIKYCVLENLEIAFLDIEQLIITIHKNVGLNGNPFNHLSGGLLVKKILTT